MTMAINHTSTALAGYSYDNIVPFEVIRGKEETKKEVKYRKDGSVKQTRSNKVAGKDAEVYAFRTEKEIADMLAVFDKHINEASNDHQKQIAYRNKLLFLIGINIGIRASDLRSLKWSYFFEQHNGSMSFKDFYVLQPMKQRKQKKFVKLFFNQTVKAAINQYVSEYPIVSLDDYLFPSRKGSEPIEVQTVWKIIKETADEAGIHQNIGSHSLRKTWGFWCFHNAQDKNKALVILQQCFNHASTQVTMRYIGLMDNEISDMYNSVELGLDML